MTKKKEKQLLCEDNLRHNEYYGMQSTIDNLYQASANGEVFTDLMSVILQRENILLAYRNIKKNTGSKTSGTDNLTIEDIGKYTPDEVVEKVRFIVNGSKHGYRPKPVRRKEIPKPYDPSKTRPLGIPCIWDRLVQQCIKQVMEPVCEAKFSNNSYGFRPNHSVENAIAKSYQLLQHANLHYVIEFDIKGFFDNVNHAKLIRQIWAMGIHDKKLIFLIKRILKAPIRLEDGTTVTPDKGTPQGGIISPLLANIVLNELDHWVESQWQWCPICKRNTRPENGYRQAKKSNLKEMFIVRYADDFRIFCRTRDVAERTKCAVTLWLKERLKLEISEKKTRIVNVRNHYSEFLGFKMKVHRKGDKLVVMSHIADKNLEHKREKLKEQAKRIVHPRKIYGEQGEIRLYNSMVTGMQNYYCIATHVNHDCASLNRTIMTLLTNRLSTRTGNRLVKKGRELTAFEKARFGKSKMIRYVAGTNEPIYPIGYTQHKNPLFRKKSWNYYTPEGREGIHDCLRINVSMMLALMRMPTYSNSAEYADNRISLFSAQWGKCAVTGDEFSHIGEIHCHHKLPRHLGGDDSYGNLVLIKDAVHKLIHASNTETIHKYMDLLQLDSKRLAKVNNLRQLTSMQPI